MFVFIDSLSVELCILILTYSTVCLVHNNIMGSYWFQSFMFCFFPVPKSFLYVEGETWVDGVQHMLFLSLAAPSVSALASENCICMANARNRSAAKNDISFPKAVGRE